MGDVILENRLLALKQYLGQIKAVPALLTRRNTQNQYVLNRIRGLLLNRERLWNLICTALNRETTREIDAVEKIEGKLKSAETLPQVLAERSVREAWAQYGELIQRCQKLFRECMDLLNGLAFREITLDESICELADELIDKCSKSVARPPGLAFPASQEPLLKVLRRIVRIPFPEWSIWTLPLIAHEYGHVAISEPTDPQLLQPFAEQRAARPRNWDSEYLKVLGQPGVLEEAKIEAEKRAAERGLFRVNEYLADAFATYVMGPAFACAAIRFRLAPSLSPGDDPYSGLDSERAIVIMAMLRKMNEPDRRFDEVIGRLDDCWQQSTNVFGAVREPIWKTKQRKLHRLVDEIWELFKIDLTDLPLYKPRDWTVAEDWAKKWIDESNGKVPQVPTNAGPDHALRDVLNAAWLCRIRSDSKATMFEDVAKRTCQVMLRKQARNASSSEVGSNTPFD